MSVDAVAWAYKQKIKSSVKFVLVTLCDFANERGRLWPSIATICERTCQDRKTVMSAIDELVRQGCLIDTGERKGDTKQVKVYEICQKDLSINCTKNGTVKEYQKRNSTKKGTVPNFPIKSTKFPYKEYQISHERVPNLVHGTIIEPYKEPLVEPSNTRAREKQPKKNDFVLPDWIPKDSWLDFEEMRKEKKKPMTLRAMEMIVRRLDDFRQRGFDIKDILDTSTRNGWTDVYEPKQPRVQQAKASLFEQNMAAAERAKRMIFGEEAA